ncbi:hypothetical protein KJ359_001653 [Pestalotiopsis sp. 9143b]|nr:hypothetical protein KJ359_001653 [Pestalotiopsis sp. 9143b]
MRSPVLFLSGLVLLAEASPCLTCTEDACLRSLKTSSSSDSARAACSSFLITTVTPEPTISTITLTSTVTQDVVETGISTSSSVITSIDTATTSETKTLALTSIKTSSDFSTFTSVHEATSTSYVTEFVTVTITSAVTQTSTISSTTTVTPAKKRDAADIARRFKTEDASSVTAYGEACTDALAYSSACRCIGVKPSTITAPVPESTYTVTQTYTEPVTATTVLVSGVAVVTVATDTITVTITSTTASTTTTVVPVVFTEDVTSTAIETETTTASLTTMATSTATVTTEEISTATASTAACSTPSLGSNIKFTIASGQFAGYVIVGSFSRSAVIVSSNPADATTWNIDSSGYLQAGTTSEYAFVYGSYSTGLAPVHFGLESSTSADYWNPISCAVDSSNALSCSWRESYRYLSVNSANNIVYLGTSASSAYTSIDLVASCV